MDVLLSVVRSLCAEVILFYYCLFLFLGSNSATITIGSCEQSAVGASGAWTNIAPLPALAYSLAMTTLNGKAYAFGGFDTVAQTAVYMFDGTSWMPKLAMSPGRYQHSVLALDTDRALICGGKAPTSYTATCVIYIASSNSYTGAANLYQARDYHCMVMFESM
jgi:hypothetical protein